MKKWIGKLLPVVLICAVIAAVVLIGFSYFDFISESIYEDSTGHLEEIYGQVNRAFGAFVNRSWGLLEGVSDYAALAGNDSESVAQYIEEKREYWGFSDFYFIAPDKTCRKIDGETRTMALDDAEWDLLMNGGQSIMAGETMNDGSEITVFAVPVGRHMEYGGFGYDAVAISYTNAAMANSLNVDAFSGQAKSFVIHDDGGVLLSVEEGGGVFTNYLVYLSAVTDLDGAEIEKINNDWKNGASGITECSIGGVNYCILYQPVGIEDYVLLGAVPESAINAGFLSVQRATMNMLLVVFLLTGATIIALLVVRGYKQSRRSMTELKYRERMFDVLSSSVDDIFIMLDAEKESVDYISPNLKRLLGIEVKEARQNIRVLEKCAVNFNVVIPRDELKEIPLNGNKYWECEYMHQSTGERRWYRMTIYHMDIQNMRKYIVVMSDRTSEQQMNQKLQEALTAAKSANEAKSNFLSNMSHDIRTPMNAIVGFSVLLEKEAGDPAKVREYTRKITSASQHLLSLINDVLDMSKIESGKTSLNVGVFSLPELLEELDIILMPQAKAKEQDFTIHVQGVPPEQILGDKLRLNQILINLLSNAIKYTPNGGTIEFTVTELPGSAPQFAKLRFTVRDNGIGMSEEFQKQVFAPFSREINSVTNKIQGTGLGMAITKNLVDLMGGIITVESELGKGSTFTVELSFSLPEENDTDLWYRQRVTRLLVADDEEDICIGIREMMRDTGVDVVYVTDGAAAVDAAVCAAADGHGYDVILLDWKMPGLDGVGAARMIRERIGEDVPILVLTSYDWSDIETEARAAGINAFMPKPFFASTFWQTIKPLFEDRGGKAGDDAVPEDVLKGRRFLVAEDNELNAEILTEMLDMEGAKCEVAANGREAVDKYSSAPAGYYDMILMDVQMPVMNGYEATREIRALPDPKASSIPIAAMTANTFAEDVRRSLDAGMDGHLAKPIDMDAVRALVGKLLGKRDADVQNWREGSEDK